MPLKISTIPMNVLAAATLALMLGGCTAIMSSTHDEPIKNDPGSRSFGSVIDDQTIEATATVNIHKSDPQLEDANVMVTSYNGVVLLSGQVPDAEARDIAARTAALVKGVRRVYNELAIGANADFAVRSSDTLITAKIKTKLLATADIKDSRVRIVTEDGTVYMLGLVTRAEGKIAGKVAQNTEGVQKVVLLFEYIDG